MSDFPPPPPSSIPPPPPSAPAPYQDGQRPFRRIGGVARSLGGVMIALAVTKVFETIGSIRDARTAQQFLDGTIKEEAYTDSIGRFGLGQFSMPLTIAAAVLTIIWMFRIGSNLRSMGRQGLSWSPGWAIWGWLTPPCIHVVPWLVLQEQWKASDPTIPPGDPSWKQRPAPAMLHLWWVLYGVVPILGFVAGFSSLWDTVRTAIENGPDSLDTTRVTAQQLVDGRLFTALTGVAHTVAAVLFMMLVRQQSARHMRCTGEA